MMDTQRKHQERSSATGRKAVLVALGVVLALVLGMSGMGASSPRKPPPIDLKDHAPAIVGGSKVAPAGDVNGDGRSDILVMDRWRPNALNHGLVHVIFGAKDLSVDVRLPLPHGFSIYGADPWDRAFKASAAGDVNGDGLEDIVIGAPYAELERPASGVVYVVYGKTDTLPVLLSTIDRLGSTPAGFRVEGPAPGSFFGDSVSGGGDIDGDGFSDIIASAPFAGSSFVIFGSAEPRPVDTRELWEGASSAGMFISTPGVYATNGWRYNVAHLGDMNGDGLSDIGIGILKNVVPPRMYVIYGHKSRTAVKASELGSGGFQVRNVYASLGRAGDVNGDGFDDVVAYGGNQASYVIWGSPAGQRVVAPEIGAAGFVIRASRRPVGSHGPGGGGDWDGDGLSDIILGADFIDFRGRSRAGRAYIVMGKSDGQDVYLFEEALVIGGAEAGQQAGYSVAFIGDVDGDGIDDWAVGAFQRGEGAIYLLSRGSS